MDLIGYERSHTIDTISHHGLMFRILRAKNDGITWHKKILVLVYDGCVVSNAFYYADKTSRNDVVFMKKFWQDQFKIEYPKSEKMNEEVIRICQWARATKKENINA